MPRPAPLAVIEVPSPRPVDVDAFCDLYARVLLAQASETPALAA
jgi:hypothetical protein